MRLQTTQPWTERSARSAAVLHRGLAAFNRPRMRPAMPFLNADDGYRAAVREHQARLIECAFVEHERARIQEQAESVPTEPKAFIAWFEALQHYGPGQDDPLFPWLAYRATRQQMTWFLRQEAAGEAGFEDLVALTQLQLPPRAKLELARNYWDEMGRGTENAMHGPMLRRLCDELGIPHEADDTVHWESLALANLMIALATHRQYAYQAVGALGVIELTAPARSAHVNHGLKRLGIDGEARRYFAMHATLDIKHSYAWNREVIAPLVAERPECAPMIAGGALMRLHSGARCFLRYRRELGLTAADPNGPSVEAWATLDG